MLGMGRRNDHGFSTWVAKLNHQETLLAAFPRKTRLAAQFAAVRRR
jgi:hypothetical protein